MGKTINLALKPVKHLHIKQDEEVSAYDLRNDRFRQVLLLYDSKIRLVMPALIMFLFILLKLVTRRTSVCCNPRDPNLIDDI